MLIEKFINDVLETELTSLERASIQEFIDQERDLPKVMFRELISRLNCITNRWAVPNKIYYAIDNKDFALAQSLLDKQKELWGYDDLEVNSAQNYIDIKNF